MKKSILLPNSLQGLKVSIIGGGSYGTALAHIASYENRHKVLMWGQDQVNCDSINNDNINKKYFPNIKLNENIKATTNIKECLEGANMIICALPVQKIVEVIEQYKDLIDPEIPFVSCSKGMIVSKKQFISEALNGIFGGKLNYVVLSGPSFAEEMIANHPTLVAVASQRPETSKFVQRALSNDIFRMYRANDLIGVEIAGALKNVLAIGAGIIEGSDFGYNTKAALVTRGTIEMQNFALTYGAKQETLFGLAGIGDLMLTAFGKLSRNRTFGFRLAKGETVDQIVSSSTSTIEGLPTLRVIKQYADEHNIDLPITSAIYDIVEGKVNIKEACDSLMKRALQDEFNLEKD